MPDLFQNHMSTRHTIRAHAQELEINRTKIKGGCWSGRKVVTHNSESDLPLLIRGCKGSLSLYSVAYLNSKNQPFILLNHEALNQAMKGNKEKKEPFRK